MRLEQGIRSVRIVAEDAGPGLPREVMFERGESSAGSTGLGLDIARRTAEAAGGSLQLDTGPFGGTRMALELPTATD